MVEACIKTSDAGRFKRFDIIFTGGKYESNQDNGFAALAGCAWAGVGRD